MSATRMCGIARRIAFGARSASSRSAARRSAAVVTFRFSVAVGSTSTVPPAASTSAASSVAFAPSAPAAA